MKDAKIRLLEWLVNEATDDQIDGLIEIIDYGDIMAGLEGLVGDGEASDFIDGIKQEAIDDYIDEQDE